VVAGNKTVAPWGRRRPTGVREPATGGPTSLLQGAAWPRGDGKRWRPSSTRQRPPPPAQARFAKGRRRRPWIRLTGGPGCTSRCRIRAWGGRGRSDDGEGGGVEHVVDGRDAAPLLRARTERGRSSPSSAVLAVEDAPSSWSTGISAALRELRSRRPDFAGGSDGALQPRPPGKEMAGGTPSPRGDARSSLDPSRAGSWRSRGEGERRSGAGSSWDAASPRMRVPGASLHFAAEAATVPPASAKRRCHRLRHRLERALLLHVAQHTGCLQGCTISIQHDQVLTSSFRAINGDEMWTTVSRKQRVAPFISLLPCILMTNEAKRILKRMNRHAKF
jgi:hypothetical protein